eukprot:CAMPEP_0117436482 /NCGR_PEP_ID=MMETSP0759-20121206/1029_1 /TAXON_ID=63605 /ORGANISM="Percolomonas cosmopolitus, Strain WS" /LENGTH=426 /DNA_ID=CAMNT_0005228081 /DNA_START=163 /DNA_END=1440 /DNA_ORIENTATION=-
MSQQQSTWNWSFSDSGQPRQQTSTSATQSSDPFTFFPTQQLPKTSSHPTTASYTFPQMTTNTPQSTGIHTQQQPFITSASSSSIVHLLVGSHKYMTTKQTLRRIPLFAKDIDELESKFDCVQIAEGSICIGTSGSGTISTRQPSAFQPFPSQQNQQQSTVSSQKYIFIDRDGSLFEHVLAFARSNGSVYALPSLYDFSTPRTNTNSLGGDSSSYVEHSYHILLNRLIDEAKYYGMEELEQKCLDLLYDVHVDDDDLLSPGQDGSFDATNMKLLQMRHYSSSEKLLDLNTTPDQSASAFPIPHTNLEFRVPYVGEYNVRQKSYVYFRFHIGDSDGHYYMEIDGEVRGQKIASTGFTFNNGLDERLQCQFAYQNNGNVEFCTELSPGNHRARLFVQGFNPNVRYTIAGPVIAQVYLVKRSIVSGIQTI